MRRPARSLVPIFALLTFASAAAAVAQEPPPILAEWSVCEHGTPGRLAWHPDGYLVSASPESKIVVFGPDGSHVRTFGSPGTGTGQFNELTGVAVGDGGDLFTSEETGRRVQRFTLTGDVVSEWATAYYPPDITADGAGHVYLATAGDDDLAKYDVNGAPIQGWSCHPCWAASTDGAGHVYGIDDNALVKYTTDGVMLWGRDLRFDFIDDDDTEPREVAAGASGRVYVSERGNNRIIVFDSKGALLSWWPADSRGLAEDDQGRLYSAEGCVIRVYSFAATPATRSSWGRLKQIYR
jgi:DNA-binding beta-propeller fold protein YncE